MRASRHRVPAVYLGWANPVFLAFFPFNRISNLRVFNAVFSSIPIARSITHDDPIGLTRLSYLNPSKKWTVLDPKWTPAGMNPGMNAFSETKNWAHLQLRFKPSSYPLAGEGSGEEDGVSVSFPT